MFTFDDYDDLKKFIKKLYKARIWNGLDPEIKKIYWRDLKRMQRELGFPEGKKTTKENDDGNEQLDGKRKRKRPKRPLSLERSMEENGFDPIDSFSVEEYFIQEELNKELYAAIDTLNKLDRDIIILYYFEGQTEREIGERLNLQQKTVNNHKQSSLKRLKELLKDFLGIYQ